MWFRKFFIAALVAVFSVSSAFGLVNYQVENQSSVLEKALQLEHKGILKQKDNGYLYIEVSRDYIAQIIPLIEAPGKLVPLNHCTSQKGVGPHISVMYEDEQIENEIWQVDEVGQEFSFSILELRTVKVNKRGKMKKLWLIAVHAPDLEKLRERYGLSSKLGGHDFHITICAQVPGQPAVREDKTFEAA